MKILYTSDLHGSKECYNKLLNKAEDKEINHILIGGDLCPRTSGTLQDNINYQKIFLENFLVPLFKKFKQDNPKKEIYLIMGNDDFRVNMDILENSDKEGILNLIHKKSIKLNEKYNIAGYSFVNTTPFRLKDWEKPDFNGSIVPNQLFDEEIRTVNKEEGTIEDDLNKLKNLSPLKKTIYVMHAPPFNTNLDITADRTHVGSRAIRKFIEQEQPPLTLHGHIHESPKMSGSWKDKIGNTVCINVGSCYPEDKLNCVIVSADLKEIDYLEI